MAGRFARLVYELRRRDGVATSLLQSGRRLFPHGQGAMGLESGTAAARTGAERLSRRVQRSRRTELTFDLLEVVAPGFTSAAFCRHSRRPGAALGGRRSRTRGSAGIRTDPLGAHTPAPPAAPCRCVSIRASSPWLCGDREPLSPQSTGAPLRAVAKSRAFLPMAQFEKRLVCDHPGIDDRLAGT